MTKPVTGPSQDPYPKPVNPRGFLGNPWVTRQEPMLHKISQIGYISCIILLSHLDISFIQHVCTVCQPTGYSKTRTGWRSGPVTDNPRVVSRSSLSSCFLLGSGHLSRIWLHFLEDTNQQRWWLYKRLLGHSITRISKLTPTYGVSYKYISLP